MSRFHNPYHFVPVSNIPRDGGLEIEKIKSGGKLDADLLRENLGHRAHDRYAPGTHSGRIVCRLKCETPLVVGAAQVKGVNAPGSVAQFKFGGRPAIPGSSLRGLISAVAEAASNSALRILEAAWNRYENGQDKSGAHSDTDAAAEFAGFCPDLVALGKDDRKKLLTIAELLFGFIEERSDREKHKTPALTFASRLRFSHGLSAQPVHLGAHAILKELSAPKPPRASFYYQPAMGANAIHTKIPGPNDVPKGRKFYLPHNLEKPAANDRADWASTERTDRQLSARPIPTGSEFWFHIDFDNLDDTELNLLCYALAPNAGYRHRLGLGKPLGLGLCRIEVAGLFLVARESRYRGAASEKPWLDESRYATASRAAFFDQSTDPRHTLERAAAGFAPAASPEKRAADFRNAAPDAHQPILRALEMLGHPGSVRHPVHYPARDRAQLERKLYEWFKSGGQNPGPNDYLRSLPGNGEELPDLDTSARVTPPPPPQPADLEGKKRRFKVKDHDREKRIQFETEYLDRTWPAEFANVSRFQRDALLARFPIGTEHEIEVLRFNPQQRRYELRLP